MWRTIGVTFKSNGRDRDDRTRRKPCFELVVFRLTLGQPEPPAVVVNHQGDVIRVVERLRSPIERRIVELPLWRGCPPDQPGKLVAVVLVACAAAFRGEIVLVPPFELC